MIRNRHVFFFLTWVLLSTGCVSVKLGDSPLKKAENVRYTAPGSPFDTFEASHVDKAWKNKRNGNSISFLSDCSASSDPSLENLTQTILNDFSGHQIVAQRNLQYNGRQALHSTVSGSVDGVPSKFDILVFKKNSCIYVLTYVAVASTYDQDAATFEKFIRGFHAP